MIEFITTSIFVFSSFYGSAVAANADYSVGAETPLISVSKEEKTTITVLTSKEIEKHVKNYFKDEPLLVEIARCESSFRQYDEKGIVLKGKVNKGDLGVMQINKYYHADKAESLGLDLENIDGNLAYARYLYEKEGAKPWISSKPCWKQALKDVPANEVAVR